jgi:hypothetical protein
MENKDWLSFNHNLCFYFGNLELIHFLLENTKKACEERIQGVNLQPKFNFKLKGHKLKRTKKKRMNDEDKEKNIQQKK